MIHKSTRLPLIDGQVTYIIPLIIHAGYTHPQDSTKYLIIWTHFAQDCRFKPGDWNLFKWPYHHKRKFCIQRIIFPMLIVIVVGNGLIVSLSILNVASFDPAMFYSHIIRLSNQDHDYSAILVSPICHDLGLFHTRSFVSNIRLAPHVNY